MLSASFIQSQLLSFLNNSHSHRTLIPKPSQVHGLNTTSFTIITNSPRNSLQFYFNHHHKTAALPLLHTARTTVSFTNSLNPPAIQAYKSQSQASHLKHRRCLTQ
jgi:hypothetical protein